MTKLDEAIRRGDDAIALLAAIVAAEKQVEKGFAEVGGTAFLKACEVRDRQVQRAAEWLEGNACPR